MEKIVIVGLLMFSLVGCASLATILRSPFALDVEEVIVDDAKKEVETTKAQQAAISPETVKK